MLIQANNAATTPVTKMPSNVPAPPIEAIGASTNIHSGPKPKARKWAQQLYLAYPEIDGLLCCTSMYGNHPAIALFERGRKAIPTRPLFHRELKDPILESVLIQTANKIGYGLV